MFGKDRRMPEKHGKARNEGASGILRAHDDNDRSSRVPKDYGVYEMTPRELRDYFLLYAPLFAGTGWLFYKNVIVSLFFGFMSIPYLRVRKRELAENRRRTLRIQFRDALCSVSSSVSAGRRMGEAISEAGEAMVLIHGSGSVIACELRHMDRLMYDAGATDEQVLHDLAVRCGIEEIINFADVYSACRTTGGDVEGIVLKAADMILERMNLDREIEVMVSQKQLEAKILTVIPLAILACLRVLSPSYLSCMDSCTGGRLIMTCAFAAMASSYIMARRISDIEA